MVLGSGDFMPMQLARAYAAFSSGGLPPKAYLISRIETANGGRVSLSGALSFFTKSIGSA